MNDENKTTTEGLSPVAMLKKYFGVRPDGYQGKDGLPGFLAEIKELSLAGKQELAALAGAELGIKLK